MNTVPTNAIRVPAAKLEGFVTQVALKLGMRQQDAELWAHLLVLNDLRGVFSHGTFQVANYLAVLRRGELNLRPDVKVVAQTPTTVVLDGDGGLGYFAAHPAVQALTEKGKSQGVAAAVTRNHGHIGAAGLYSRLPLEHGLACFGTSGHGLNLRPERSVLDCAGASPMTFAIPAGNEPPLVVDFGTMHDVMRNGEDMAQFMTMAPGIVFRAMGLGAVCQALGGILAGHTPINDPNHWSCIANVIGKYPAANQGSLFVVLDLSRLGDLDHFKRGMDEYVRSARVMQPLPGQTTSSLAGGPEWQHQREWQEIGIPIDKKHEDSLNFVASEFKVPSPC